MAFIYAIDETGMFQSIFVRNVQFAYVPRSRNYERSVCYAITLVHLIGCTTNAFIVIFVARARTFCHVTLLPLKTLWLLLENKM